MFSYLHEYESHFIPQASGNLLKSRDLKRDGDVLNIPLFMADHIDRLIGLALEQ